MSNGLLQRSVTTSVARNLADTTKTSPKMMSVGLHCRIVGRPGRAASLMRFLDYVISHERVWVPTRLQIAQHWHANLSHLAANAPNVG